MKTQTGPWNLYSVDQPQQIVAGFSVMDNETPIYFDCCECGEEDAVIHGYMAMSPEREDVAILRKPDGRFLRPAYYCGTCWQALLSKSD